MAMPVLATCRFHRPIRQSVTSAARPGYRQLRCVCKHSASKGFGSKGRAKSRTIDEGDDEPTKRKVKVKRLDRPQGVIPGQQAEEQQRLAGVQIKTPEDIAEELRRKEEDLAFAERLSMLKERARSPDATSTADAAVDGQAPRPAAFDAKLPDAATGGAGGGTRGSSISSTDVDIYANPPTLRETLLNKLNEDISDPALRTQQYGPGQIALGASAVVFALVFLVVSGADFQTSKRYKGVRPSKGPPDAIEEGILKSRVAQLESDMRANPDSTEALEAAAVTYAQLYDFERAATLLERLVDRRPADVEAWRLLGETSLLAQKSGKAVQAYERAVALKQQDLQILTGLTDAYIANGEQARAVTQLTAVRDKLAQQPLPTSPAAAASAAAQPASPPAAASEAVAKAQTTAAPGLTASAQPASAPAAASEPIAERDGTAAPAPTAAVPSASAPSAAVDSASEQEIAATPAPASSTAATALLDSSNNDDAAMPLSVGEDTDAPGSVAPAVPSASSQPEPAAPATAAASGTAASSGVSGSDGSVASSGRAAASTIDPVAVDLLLGKVYSGWRGHDPDAAAVYDRIVKQHPQDFRGYLAKGVFLKERGRKAESERMFMQAKFYAPGSRQAFVKRLTDTAPVLDLPDN